MIENLNGMFRELDRDLDHLHQFSAELRAGADLLSRLEDGAVIVVGSVVAYNVICGRREHKERVPAQGEKQQSC